MIDTKKTIRIYTGNFLEDVPIVPFLRSFYGQKYAGRELFKDFFSDLDFSFFEIVETPEEADIFLVPHDYFTLKRGNFEEYLKVFRNSVKLHNKPAVLIAHGDSDEDIFFPEGVIFRTSQYRYKQKENEIIMPPYVEDLGAMHDVVLRTKQEVPTVGFCGWASFASVRQHISYYIKLIWNRFTTFFRGRRAFVKRQGIFFRQKMLAVCEHSSLVDTNFVLRKGFSGHRDTITLSPEIARREYIENMQKSDFVLAPKGDGNYSMRFYETLSLGRIPVLLDTDCALPFESEIAYEDIVVTVPLKESIHTPTFVSDFYASVSDKEYKKRQNAARKIFVSRLRTDAFLQQAFSQLLQ
jgi:hypothetical protein